MQYIKKLGIYIVLIILSAIIAGVYGMLHDQFTYTVSSEYYTKFKFIQFGFTDSENAIIVQPRLWVSAVGFLATWWMGLAIGIVLSFVGLLHVDYKTMFKITLQAIFITILITAIVGTIGLGYGYLFLANKPREYFTGWFLPADLIDFKNFIAVGSMHNFGYIGSVIGFIMGALFSLYKSKKVFTWLLFKQHN